MNGGRLDSDPTTPTGRTALPTDPKALLALVYRQSGHTPFGRDAAAFSTIRS
ncbi:hypothetical protein GCM10023196_056840 [Actinoallomurus vinaceus]|uniref:Uncharacterized protein n=1 Tax=Actinoallomurus vinaceus TaxID=1080074 RepID=A0ABP8UJN8_9ACTN